MCDCYEDIPM